MDSELPWTLGPYVLVEELGVGGFATVYRGVLQGSMGFARDFAVKVLAPEAAEASPEMIQLLADEARALARIRHRSVVSPHWFGVIEDPDRGSVFILVMEYVAGTTLHSLLGLEENEDGVEDRAVVVSIGLRLAEALETVHSLADEDGKPLGLVHRDIKPGNIMITASGEVVLLDFGIAKARNRLADATRSDRIRGTIGYLAPEQIAGDSIDHRADQFALGAVLYELVTGERLLGDVTVLEQLRLIATFDPTEHLARLRFEFPEIEPLMARLLSRFPEDRFDSTSEVVERLVALQEEMAGSDRSLGGWAAGRVREARELDRELRALRAVSTIPIADRSDTPPEPPPPPATVPPPPAPPASGLPVVPFAVGASVGAVAGFLLG